MDNLTHSIAGMLVAEMVSSAAARRGHEPHRRLLYTTSIVANNLPDIDFVLTPLTQGKLGYLLHHRGHTHTIVVALGLALAQSALCAFWLRRRHDERWAHAGLQVAIVSCVGVLVHLLLDFGNNYGVHPFWPIDARWYYGEAVFILEPWWWSIGGATLMRLVRSRAAKITQGIVWLLGTALPWLMPLPIEAQLYGSLWGVLALATSRLELSHLRRVSVAVGLLLTLYAGQVLARSYARAQLDAALEGERLTQTASAETTSVASSSLRVLDVVQTPLPGAPWCWDFLVVGHTLDEKRPMYVVRVARATAVPGLDAARCTKMRPAPTATLDPVPASTSQRVVWDGEYRAPLEDFAAVARSCWGIAFLRYARAPFFQHEGRVVGDLRYDRQTELEFGELELPASDAACPEWVPGWSPPRQDLIDTVAP